MEIAGKSALVTGAAGGIGLAIARTLREGGAQPVLADIDADELTRAATSLGGAPPFRSMSPTVPPGQRRVTASALSTSSSAMPASAPTAAPSRTWTRRRSIG